MISFDTNLLLYSLNRDCAEYDRARAFFSSLPTTPSSVVVCELVLLELYVVLRNPAVLKKPLSGPKAASLVQAFRRHPSWVLVDYPGTGSGVMDRVWKHAADPTVGRRTVFDARLALALRHHGVTEFATRNTGHFAGYGFVRVWDPILA
ncbi:MAG TPA: TA system VapC family ribonuclease toxin [Opitutaceae bacterium]|nr:TA system VapC family ribonuclease toxin [Opitutaceae bacterium]